MEEQRQELDVNDAASVLLGDDPTKDWTPEQRAEVAELFKTLDRPPEPEKVDLREHFRAGEIIKDPNGLRIVVRSVGQSAMCVEVLGKKGRFSNGHFVNIGAFAFMTTRAKKSACIFEHLGPAMPVSAPAQIPRMQQAAPEMSTQADGGNDPKTVSEAIKEKLDKEVLDRIDEVIKEEDVGLYGSSQHLMLPSHEFLSIVDEIFQHSPADYHGEEETVNVTEGMTF